MTAEPSGALGDVVALVDRLVSPGGCPWDAAQTHRTLTAFVVEEAYEVVEVIEAAASGGEPDDADLAEELGDLLLQVLLHARLAQGRGAFDIDAVAAGLSAKLIRRHPHVFSGRAADPSGADIPLEAADVADRWEQLKTAENPDRGLFDSIPAQLPALARAAKVAGRLRRSGREPSLPPAPGGDDAQDIGWAMYAMAAQAEARGVDPEAALRAVTRAVQDAAPTAPVGSDRAVSTVHKPGTRDAASSH